MNEPRTWSTGESTEHETYRKDKFVIGDWTWTNIIAWTCVLLVVLALSVLLGWTIHTLGWALPICSR